MAMDRKEKELIIRLDERLQGCQKEINTKFQLIQEDVKEIKDSINRVRGCTSNLHDDVGKLDNRVNENKIRIENHLKNVNESTSRWRWLSNWGTNAVAIFVAAIAIWIAML